jgi:DNA replication and repair protein RecF
MLLKRLRLLNFKNYEDEQFFFDTYINCFYGLNGMGKTNILDAIYYLCLGKSYYTVLDKNIVRTGESFFRLEADFQSESRLNTIVSKVVPGSRKEFELNGTKLSSLEEYIGSNPVVFITPDDIFTLLNGNEERRAFVNNIIVQYDVQYLTNLSFYNKLLKQRNALLKDFQVRKYYDEDLLNILTERLAPHANYIYEARSKMMDEFIPIVYNQYATISDQNEQIHMAYNSQLESKDFLIESKSSLEKDRILGRTNVGIHKDEIILTINNKPLKDFGSQGQIKSFVMALKLAQAEYFLQMLTTKPILLLDDIFDKLDPKRIARLLESINSEMFCQVFISDTHKGRVADLITGGASYATFLISEGRNVPTDKE